MAAAKSVQELQKLTAAEPRNAAAWHQLGNALLDEGKFDRGISAFRRALRIDDSLAEVHNDLGTAYFDKTWYREAEECFHKAIAARPDHGVAHANLGAALRAQGKLSEGRRAFQRALLLKIRDMLPAILRWRVAPERAAEAPPAVPVQELKALTQAIKAGRLQESLQLARSLEERHPGDPDVLHLSGLALDEGRQYDAAIAKLSAAIAIKPDRSEYHMALARAYVHALRHGDALQAASQALRLEPGSAPMLAAIAGIYHPWREDLAVATAREALAIDATSDIAHGNLAAALWGLGQLEEAENHGREAVRLAPQQLSYRANLALILKDLGKIEDAQELYRQMIAEAPDYPKLCMDMGTLAIECEGDLEAARRWYRKAQGVSDNPRAFLGEGIANLLEGNFALGWDQYEARKKVHDQYFQQVPFARFPVWQGEPLERGRLLVYGEQGLGDEIMFASMYAEAAQRAQGQVSVMCDARLGGLFARSFPHYEVIAEERENFAARAGQLAGFSHAISAGSLGRLFRQRPAEFPQHRGYLAADADKVAAWRDRLATLGPGLKVGLSWIGGHQRTGRARRSLSLEQLRPVLSLRGAQWVSLQYTDAAAEIAAFHQAGGAELRQFPGVTQDMDDLAGLIGALDLVVSVCNTTVHVAGATGREVLVMAPFVPEWRYGMKGERMIWYPSARVFRQAAYGKWEDVIARVAGELKSRLAAGGAADVVDQ
jgi:tetratricopeptide (TPR) repeat protein